MRRSRHGWGVSLTAALAAVALVSGCTGDDGEGPADPDTHTAVEDVAPGPSGSLRLTGWLEEHPRRVALALLGVEVDEGGHLLLEVEGVNRGHLGQSSATIAEFGVNVRDDLGNRYSFQRPEENRGLQFLADERLTGTLAFEGPIDPEARYLDVAFNQSLDDAVPAADDSLSQYPVFLFERVPLPGVGLEAEAVAGPSSDLMAEQVVEVDQAAEVEFRDDVEVRLVRYVVGGGIITFEIEAVNRGDQRVQLAYGVTKLLDDRDTTFVFERDQSEDRDQRVLRLEPGEELTATLAFRGVIPADAESLTLTTNGGAQGNPALRETPYMEFTGIPVPD